MALLVTVQLSYELSFPIGKGMIVDLDSAVEARVASLGEEVRTRPLDKSSNRRSLGSNRLKNVGLGLLALPVAPTGAIMTGPREPPKSANSP